jgi:hypothetical protein
MLLVNILPSMHTPVGPGLLAASYYHFGLEVPTQFIFLTFIGGLTIEVERARAQVNSFLLEVTYEFGDRPDYHRCIFRHHASCGLAEPASVS